MPPDRESTVLSAVSLALEQPAGNRHSFLAAQLRDDRDAQAEAASILNYETRETMFLQQPATRHFAPGECVDRFRIVGLLGSGGMGDVYEVEDPQNPEGRHRALKTIRADFASDPALANQFKREIHLGQTITHPNVCRIFDLGTHVAPDGSQILFLTMELLEGETLAQRLKAGPMTTAEALPIIRQVANALAAAHERNVVHRDLKPGNIILVPASKGGPPRAVVTDFGLAVEAGDARDAVPIRRPSGTPDYMSPEQVQCGPIDCVSDIYSLAVVAYEMVSGKFPFHGERALYRMAERLRVPPVALAARCPGISPEWSAALTRALDRDASKRYQTVQELVAALERAERSSEAATIAIEPVRWTKRKPKAAVRWAAGALVLLLLVGGWTTRKQIHDLFYPLPDARRIAFLPFENLDEGTAERAYAAGITQTLVSGLTELEPLQGKLSIVPESEIRAKKVATVQEASIVFGATLVVTGSITRPQRGGVHMIINLVDAKKVAQLRSRELYVNPDDPAAMQRMILSQVAEILQLEMQPQSAQKLAQSTTHSPAAYDYYLRGLGYLTTRDAQDNAIIEFKLALKEDAKYALAHAGLCEAYWNKYASSHQKQWIPLAWEECHTAIDLNPKIAHPHIALAILDSGTGNYEDAAAHARTAISIEPRNDQGYAELAKAQAELGHDKEAEATLLQAVNLRPNDALNQNRLATFFFKRARYQEAAAHYRQVLALTPDNPVGYTNLGIVYFKMGNLAEAERYLQQSMQLKPTYQAASNLGFVYFSNGNYKESVPMFEQAAQLNSHDYLVWGNLGDAYHWSKGNGQNEANAYKKAIALADDELSVNPNSLAPLSDQAVYRAKSGDIKKALESTSSVLARAPSNVDCLYNAALVYEIAGKRSLAVDYLVRAVKGGYSKQEIESEPEFAKIRRERLYLAGTRDITTK